MTEKPKKVDEISFDEGTADTYLAMLLKHRESFKKAAEYIQSTAFSVLIPFDNSYPAYWLCLSFAIKKYPDIVLTEDLVRRGSFTKLKKELGNEEIAKERTEEVVELFKRVSALDVTPDLKWINDHTRFIMSRGQVAPRLKEIMAEADDKKITVEQAINEAHELKKQLGPSDRTHIDPFSLENMLPEEDTSNLEKTYVDWFDAAVGGGLLKNEPHTLIMPTGQGKTTMSSMIAGYRAKHGKKTMVVITEGGLSRRITSKVQAALLNFEADLFLLDKNSPLNATNREKLSDAQKGFLKAAVGAVRYIDLVDHGTGVTFSDFVTEYEKAISEGFKPELIIIDWAGLLAKSLVDNGQYQEQHQALEHIAVSCVNFCKTTEIPILITQQVAAAIAEEKGISPKYVVQDVDGCKKWANHFCNAVISTKFDEDGYGTFYFEKVRYGPPNQYIIVKRDGAKAQFHKADDGYEFEKGAYINMDTASSFGKSSKRPTSGVDL